MYTARDFYYLYIAPEENYKNYQSVHQADLTDIMDKDPSYREGWDRVLRYKPELSNDIGINSIVKDLIKRSTNKIKPGFDNIFVAKQKDFTFNAFATETKDSYIGDLVFFHVGLSDACFQYSIIFTEFVNLITERSKLDNNPKVENLQSMLTEHMLKLKLAQSKWILEGDIINLEESTVIVSSKTIEKKAVDISMTTDLFILGHEISHHFLGHTGTEDVGTDILSRLPNDCQMWQGESKKHSRELMADALSLLLVAGCTEPQLWKNISRESYAIQAALGSFLTLTVIGQCSPGSNKASESHPSTKLRFEQCKAILNVLIDSNLLNSIEDDIFRFQYLLYKTHERGLGANIPSILVKTWKE